MKQSSRRVHRTTERAELVRIDVRPIAHRSENFPAALAKQVRRPKACDSPRIDRAILASLAKVSAAADLIGSSLQTTDGGEQSRAAGAGEEEQ